MAKNGNCSASTSAPGPLAIITIELGRDGRCLLSSRIGGRHDSTYMVMPDAKVMPKAQALLIELRAQLSHHSAQEA